MISLNELMIDGSIVGYMMLALVIGVEILFIAAIICVIAMSRRLKKHQLQTEQYLQSIEQELQGLKRVLETKKRLIMTEIRDCSNTCCTMKEKQVVFAWLNTTCFFAYRRGVILRSGRR